jgi:lycopene cyclase CruP
MSGTPISLDNLLESQSPSLQTLRHLDQQIQGWRRQGTLFPNPSQIVQNQLSPIHSPDFDLVIGGGTLGILLGAGLVRRGWRVAVIERGQLLGREQEWNVSRRELQVLLELELITELQLEEAIATSFNPNRIEFLGGNPIWVNDILNLGVSPRILLAQLKDSFLAEGGVLLERHRLQTVQVHPDGVTVELNASKSPDIVTVTSRLLIDAMGHFSPLVAQARATQSPDGVCMVVGTCATGIPHQDSGDLMVSITPIQQDCQYFWEAFPAATGRTTYLFTYVDLHPERPSLEKLFSDYFEQLPQYQQCELAEISVQRALFGLFPSYQRSPLQFDWPRILAVGDSSGQQSPLSFGGFGAMLRHLSRLIRGIDEALQVEALTPSDLQLLQPYQPNLSSTWMFQRAMSPQVGQSLEPNQINQLLNEVFKTMTALGDEVLEPFLQDVVQFKGLTQTLGMMSLKSPQLIPKILTQVGLSSLLGWMPHYLKLGGYTALITIESQIQAWSDRLPDEQRYQWQRRLEAWTYGAGLEHHR